MEGDTLEQEGPPGRAKHRVERRQQARIGSPVHIQGVVARCIAAGGQISEDVRAPEAVDGLLGVADQKHRLAGIGVDAPEDVVLNRISVLKLVDQGSEIAVAQSLAQRRALPRMTQGTV